jgi:hypothetical protein
MKGAAVRQLTSLDAQFLAFEDGRNHGHAHHCIPPAVLARASRIVGSLAHASAASRRSTS